MEVDGALASAGLFRATVSSPESAQEGAGRPTAALIEASAADDPPQPRQLPARGTVDAIGPPGKAEPQSSRPRSRPCPSVRNRPSIHAGDGVSSITAHARQDAANAAEAGTAVAPRS